MLKFVMMPPQDELQRQWSRRLEQTVARSMTIQEAGREIQLLLLGRAHTDGDLFIYLSKEKVMVTGDAVVDWMPFLGDGYPEEWIETLNALEQVDFTHMILGHGEVAPKSHLTFFRNYLTDLIASVKQAAADGATVTEMQTTVAEQRAPKYEQGMSKYPLGQYRDRIGPTIEIVYHKVVQTPYKLAENRNQEETVMSGVQIVFDHVHIICKDPDSAAAWYADMLGGTITRRAEVRGAPQIAVQFEGATILVRGQRPGEQPGSKNPLQSFDNFVSHDQWGTDHFGFKVVGNLTEFCTAIREKGGEFSVEPYEFVPGTRIAYLAGPDGVSIELVESKAP